MKTTYENGVEHAQDMQGARGVIAHLARAAQDYQEGVSSGNGPSDKVERGLVDAIARANQWLVQDTTAAFVRIAIMRQATATEGAAA